jgi:hypothetical protein
MRRRAFLSVLGVAVLTFAPISGVAGVGVTVDVAPPAPVVETVPPPPAPGYVWQAGYRAWDGFNYVWGAWEVCQDTSSSCGMGAGHWRR